MLEFIGTVLLLIIAADIGILIRHFVFRGNKKQTIVIMIIFNILIIVLAGVNYNEWVINNIKGR